MNNNQTKSKQRVADHGEVFTAEREVNAMLDLVKDETVRIDSRFLEPACGDGNFLAEILRRKLAVVKQRYHNNPADYERYAVIAVTSIYGVDILQDNVADCQNRLFDIFDEQYTAICRNVITDDTRQAVRHILERNIPCGDALTMKTADGEPIIFAEWAAVNGSMLKRRDYRLDQLLKESEKDLQLDLFGDSGGYDYDKAGEIILKPVAEYEVIHYKRVWEAKKYE